jgi:hypothetical protein
VAFLHRIIERTENQVYPAIPPPDYRHKYKAHKKYPWFCECGYPEHDTVKHIIPNTHMSKSPEIKGK